MTRAAPSAMFGPRRIFVWGLAWSLSLTVAEATIISGIDSVPWDTLLLWLMLQWLMPLWWLTGCAILWAAQRGERAAGTAGMVAGLVIVGSLSGCLQPLIGWIVMPARTVLFEGRMENMAALMPRSDAYAWLSLALYQLWICLCYGGLLVLAYALVSRRERMQRLLHVSALARSRAETLLGTERLQAQESQIDPRLLLAAVHDIESRYRRDPSGGDRLLAALVDFLQCAMAGLRERASTLQDELTLARAYLRLQAERGACTEWRIETPAASPRLSAAFPSLLMLPLLALADAGRPAQIAVRAEADELRLSLTGLAQPPGSQLQARIRQSLTALNTDIVLEMTTWQGELHVFRRNG